MDYPVVLERDDNDTVLVSFPDFPEAHTFGDDEEDALARAADALATVIDAYIKDRRDIPLPSAIFTKHRVTLPALVDAKVRLYESMRAARVNKSELARRLAWHAPQVDRLLEMTHASRLEQIEAAFRALGKRLVVSIEDIGRPFKAAPRRRLAGGRRHRAAVSGDEARRRREKRSS
jgi:antitoxin HicB